MVELESRHDNIALYVIHVIGFYLYIASQLLFCRPVYLIHSMKVSSFCIVSRNKQNLRFRVGMSDVLDVEMILKCFALSHVPLILMKNANIFTLQSIYLNYKNKLFNVFSQCWLAWHTSALLALSLLNGITIHKARLLIQISESILLDLRTYMYWIMVYR